MSQFLAILRFELRYYLTRISTHVYFLIFAALAGLMAVASGGGFKSVQVGVGGGGGIVHVNSPHVLFGLISGMSLFGIIVVAAISGNAIYRDYEAVIHPLFFTSPVKKSSYLLGRFAGATLVNLYVMLGIPVGLFIGFMLPMLDQKAVGPTMPLAYLHPMLITVLPNIVFTGAIFFALAAFTRQMLPNYLGGVLLLVGYTLAGVLAANIEYETLAALLDPFGFNAFDQAAKYWTASEKNANLLPFSGLVLVNRLIWLGAGLGVFGIVLARFRFAHVASEKIDRRRARAEWEERSSEYKGALARREGLPDVTRDHGPRARGAQFLSTTRRAFASVVTNVYFYAIAGAGVLFLLLSATQLDQIYGTATWPVTYGVIELLTGSFGLFVLIVIAFYSGEMVWQERDRKMHQIHDALPVPTWVPFLSKLTAMVLVVVTLQAILMACGIVLQAAKGYFRFEPMLYVKELFGLQLINWALLIALVLLVQALVNNKYMGHFIVILYFIGRGFMGRLGLEHLLFQYGSDPGTAYSDMNRFGPFLGPFAWFKVYWAAVALLLAVLTNLLWPRGQEETAGWRVALARQRVSRPVTVFAGAALLVAIAAGAFIFWNTNVLNTYRTSYEGQELRARYEREYKQFENLPQPRIVASMVDATLWPKRQAGRFRGTLRAVNKSGEPIREVHVLLPDDADVASMVFDPPATQTRADAELGYFIWTYDAPLAAGKETTLQYDLIYEEQGFTNSGRGTAIVDNGSFVNSGVLPSFGYAPGGELSDDDTRRKHDLPERERMAAVDDLEARRNTYISRDADWIDFEAVVCTDPDQLAIAPGYLKEEFQREDRRCFHYVMDSPILNFYSFLSARYTVEKDAWNDVAIEVWHHAAHHYNVRKMIDAVKKSLDTYTKDFGPYQHRQVRIVEFPRYATFAQSFPNTIPYSESIGFIARVKDAAKDIDYPFYVTAHEVAHQWFAHQIIGGDVQGSTLLSESLSQYAALKVMEKEFGEPVMVKFLKYEMDRYLQGRAFERKKELPLLLVENQQYIHYNKGSIVLYALADYIGTDRFNLAVRNYLAKVKFQDPPYTNSLEFLAELRAVTPPELQYLLDDMLVHITLYDTRVVSATASKADDGTWDVTLEITCAKYRADEEGTETEVPMNDLVDVGAYAEGKSRERMDDEALVVERVRLVSGKNTIHLKSPKFPDKAGADQRLLLIDRHLDDNLVSVKTGKAIPAS